jgi:3-oxoacyl-[acyl-carrier protein] reductase
LAKSISVGQTLANRVALVTGSSRGIGAAIARRLAADGASVVTHGSGSVDQARAVASEIVKGGGNAQAVEADLSQANGAVELISSAFDLYGRLDILVNNAGVFDGGPVDQVSEEQIDRMLAVNVRAVILATREFARKTRTPCGRVINISSIAARMPSAGSSVYAASKAAVESLTRSHAVELGGRQITVNCVAPGTTKTAMSETGFPPGSLNLIASASPLRRLGRPEDIAELVAFVSSDAAGWITGQVIGADGGQLTSAKTLLQVAEVARQNRS